MAVTYFIEAVVPPHTYKMAAVIFLLGEPGWTKKKTNWTFGPEDPAFSNFEFPSGTFRVELAVSERIISVVGEEVDSTVFNVLAVSGVPTAEARIVHREKLDLSVPFESDPVREVLLQSEALRKTLGLELRDRHAMLGALGSIRQGLGGDMATQNSGGNNLEKAEIGLFRDGRARKLSDASGPVARIDGYTVGAPLMTREPPHGGEMHPDGGELMFLVSGRVSIVLEDEDPPRNVDLAPGEAFLVPKGVWHRVLLSEPSQLLYITPGPRGEHRPLAKQEGG